MGDSAVNVNSPKHVTRTPTSVSHRPLAPVRQTAQPRIAGTTAAEDCVEPAPLAPPVLPRERAAPSANPNVQEKNVGMMAVADFAVSVSEPRCVDKRESAKNPSPSVHLTAQGKSAGKMDAEAVVANAAKA